jgi:hypothetical protein
MHSGKYITAHSVADPDPGSGICCHFDPRIRDPGWIKKSGSGSGMNNPDHISESLTIDADPGSGMEKSQIRIRNTAFFYSLFGKFTVEVGG